MNSIEILIGLIKQFEGCRLKAYQCPAKKWTIGYGCTGSGITEGVEWNQRHADIELHTRAEKAIYDALKASPILLKQNPEKQAAIADLIYNLGLGGYVGHSLKPLIDIGAWEEAAKELMLFCHANGKIEKGLLRRREAEAKLLLL